MHFIEGFGLSMGILLAGDVGCSKTDLAVFRVEDGLGAPLAEATFSSANYDNLEAMVDDFLAQIRTSVDYASFGVAGPVIEGHARITNLPWVIDEKALAETLRISAVHLLNDLEATAKWVPFLKQSDVSTLHRHKSDTKGPVAVIAAGTGLGEAFLTWDGQRYRAHPSEGGHADFAPTNQSEIELLHHLQRRLDHVSYEEVCSGIGIRNIHEYLHGTALPEPPSRHAKELEASDDPVPLIAEAALRENPKCETCPRTLDLFVSILGAEAGNLALKVMATGGVYIAGGIPRKILPLLKDGAFMDSFRRKGRMSELIGSMPVFVILSPRTALLGAAHSGIEHMRLSKEMSRKVRR